MDRGQRVQPCIDVQCTLPRGTQECLHIGIPKAMQKIAHSACHYSATMVVLLGYEAPSHSCNSCSRTLTELIDFVR